MFKPSTELFSDSFPLVSFVAFYSAQSKCAEYFYVMYCDRTDGMELVFSNSMLAV